MPHVFTQTTFMRKTIKMIDICNSSVHTVRHFHTKEKYYNILWGYKLFPCLRCQISDDGTTLVLVIRHQGVSAGTEPNSLHLRNQSQDRF